MSIIQICAMQGLEVGFLDTKEEKERTMMELYQQTLRFEFLIASVSA
jgi:hypothetical protein